MYICVYVLFLSPLLNLTFPLAFKILETSGLNVTLEDVANTDHFSITEQLVDVEYHLTKVQIKSNVKVIFSRCDIFQNVLFPSFSDL